MLGDLYLGESSPIADKKKKRPQLGNRSVGPNYTNLLKAMAELCCAATTDSTAQFGGSRSFCCAQLLMRVLDAA